MFTILAYVGPGPGLSMGWALIALLGTIFAAILAVFLWPLRVMIRRLRGGEEEEQEQLTGSEAAEALPAAETETATNS